MIFYNEPSFFTFLSSLKKCSVMVLGEYDYEKLFFSKQIFPLAPFIFFPFIIIMTILMMNLLLGLAIGDIAINMQNARQKANAYRIRELIYIETTLPIKWLKNNITEDQIIEVKLTSITANKQDEIRDEDDNDDNKSTKRIPELQMIYDIVVMLCNQAKSLLTTEINFEQSLKKLLTAKQLNTQLQSMISVDDTII
ncbi:unnamed protein product [Didymodactylos carnosus]|nr:unnamed protein product [Didymodactylos carnosus]CAF4299954.1 unnamed protein product [Didymodactylos carnosus]